ncbi:MAG: hypothetical protein ABI633_10935 [Burkholderiales bacterium]
MKLGIGAAAILALAGGGLALLRPGWVDGRLSSDANIVMRAVARAVLAGNLPADAVEREAALHGHMKRLGDTIAGFPAATQDELSQLLALLASAPGRTLLAGLHTAWDEASVEALSASLQEMLTSSLALRQQAFHALRDLTNAAYFSDSSTWPMLGYPGPMDI